MPAGHATQLPALQTPPGHGVPFTRFPVDTHIAVPAEHAIVPDSH
jgi:hypothetical protein